MEWNQKKISQNFFHNFFTNFYFANFFGNFFEKNFRKQILKKYFSFFKKNLLKKYFLKNIFFKIKFFNFAKVVKRTWNPPKMGESNPTQMGKLDTFGYKVSYPKISNQTQNMKTWYPKVPSSIPRSPTKKALNLFTIFLITNFSTLVGTISTCYLFLQKNQDSSPSSIFLNEDMVAKKGHLSSFKEEHRISFAKILVSWRIP